MQASQAFLIRWFSKKKGLRKGTQGCVNNRVHVRRRKKKGKGRGDERKQMKRNRCKQAAV